MLAVGKPRPEMRRSCTGGELAAVEGGGSKSLERATRRAAVTQIGEQAAASEKQIGKVVVMAGVCDDHKLLRDECVSVDAARFAFKGAQLGAGRAQRAAANRSSARQPRQAGKAACQAQAASAGGLCRCRCGWRAGRRKASCAICLTALRASQASALRQFPGCAKYAVGHERGNR